MKLFSMRYQPNSPAIQRLTKLAGIPDGSENENEFLSEKLRNRLAYVIKYVGSQEGFLEDFLVVDNQALGTRYIHQTSLRELSEAEIGYDITDYFDAKALKLKYTAHDFALFDLIELTLIFCKSTKRDDIRDRYVNVFQDESYPLIILDWMLVPSIDNGLLNIATLLKDKDMKEKLRTVYPYKYGNKTTLTPEGAARASADMLQYVFSSDKSKSGTKAYSEGLVDKVAGRWTTPSKKDELKQLLNEQVQLAKKFNNQIANVRHTDKHTIHTSYPGIFELIFSINMAIVELVLTSVQSDFIDDTKPDDIKNKYLKAYSIENSGWVVRPKTPEIDLDDIPF